MVDHALQGHAPLQDAGQHATQIGPRRHPRSEVVKPSAAGLAHRPWDLAQTQELAAPHT
jgi:hypothetical protein